MSLATPFIKPLQIAINNYLDYDPEVPNQLAKMHNKVVQLNLQPFELSLYIIITDDGLDIRDEFDSNVDTKISGSPLSLAMMGLSEASTSSLFSGDVSIEGDTELGGQFQTFLENIQVDWEEPLSKLTGDVVANQIGDFVRDFSAWMGETTSTNALNVSEYFREEQIMLPSKFEVNKFKTSVDELRLSTDRLEAKVQRLLANKQTLENEPTKGVT
ncbi:MAG: SCP2 sterol-binding domain-containing protein [Cycloclasticus sp.]|nr:SCP2 sterol-binding domain-containing protein [Cycloclasticus sp.]